MIVVYLIKPQPYYVETLIDATIMTVLIFPLVYFLSFRHLMLNIDQREQVETALWESNEFLEKMFSITHVLIAYMDADFNFIRVNRAYAHADGRDPEFYTGKNHFDLFPHEENEGIFRNVVETGEPYFIFEKPFEYAEHPERGVSYWDWSLIPINTEGKEVSGVVLTLLDVTTRKKAEMALATEQQRLYTLLDQLPAFICLQSPDYSIQFANSRFRQLFGEPEDKRCYEVMHGYSDPCPDCRIPWVLKNEVTQTWEKTYADGRSYQIYGYPFSDADSSPLVLELGVDITETKQAQATIQQNVERAIVLTETLQTIMEAGPDYQAVLNMIARSTADLIGDGCVIRLISDDRMTHAPAAFHHSDPGTYQLLSEFIKSDVRPIDAGLTGYVIQSGRPLFVPSPETDQADPRTRSVYSTYFENHKFKSLLSVPLNARGKLIGTLALFRNKTEKPYSQEDLEFAQSLADQAALAIQNARLYEAELNARQTAEILTDASLALTQTLNLDRVMEKLLEFAGKLVPHDRAAIFLTADERHMKLQAMRGYEEAEPVAILSFDLENAFFRNLVARQKSVLIPDLKDAPELMRAWKGKQAGSWLAVPMIAEEKAIGLFVLEETLPGSFTRQHVQLVEALVGQVSVTIQNAWLFEQVRAGRERLQSLSRRLVEVQESERRYIARELHDEASQALTSLMVGLRLIERDAGKTEAIVAGVSELKQIADGVIENLHRLAMDLRPTSLDHLGLVAALEQHVEAISERHELSMQFEAIGMEARLSPEVETSLYRIVQEALSNVILHAQATRVDVLLEKRGDKVIAIVEDNGTGFDPFAAAQRGRLGLAGMRERAEMLGGSLIIESRPGSGTTLLVEMPYGD